METELALMRQEAVQRDSLRGARLNEMIELQQVLMDSLSATRQDVSSIQGALSGDLYRIQQQLVQVQELTGQSQQRLSELRSQLETRSQQVAAPAPGDTSAGGAPPAGGGPSADQMYEASLQQLRRGSVATARMGFRQLLQVHPSSPRVADALYFIGESRASESADSAARYYEQVVTTHPTSTRAPGALYKLGLLAERRRDVPAARAYFSRVAKDYPRSEEAALVPDKLKALGQ